MTGFELRKKFEEKGIGRLYDSLNAKYFADGRAITHSIEFENTGLKFSAIDHTMANVAYWFENGMKGEKNHSVGLFIDRNGRVEIYEHISEMTEEAKRIGYTSIGDVYSDIATGAVVPSRSNSAESLKTYQALSTRLPVEFDENVIIDKLKDACPGLEDLYEFAMNGNDKPIKNREASAKLKNVMSLKQGLLGKLNILKGKDKKTEDRSFGEK